MLKKINPIFFIILSGVLFCSSFVLAQWDVTDQPQGKTVSDIKTEGIDIKIEPAKTVEMQADQVEYGSGDNVARAKGNVVVTSGTTTLFADQVELDRAKQQAVANGHVYVDAPQFQVDADTGKFNFNDKNGQFTNARVFNDPFQIKGRTITKISDTHTVMENGYMTTCDHDVPHFRIAMRKMDMYPGDRAIARGVKVFVGPMPVMYLPKYTQDLKNKPWFTFMPGYKKDLGYFLLTRSRIKINQYVSTTLLLDAYERTGFAWGSETKYKTPAVGDGLVRTYFINERAIGAKHPWKEKTISTVQNERYRLEWRHKWDIDPKTTALWQDYRLSDDVLLNKYFQREFRTDPGAGTYFLLTRAMPVGFLSARVDRRVNRFVGDVDRTPELAYSLVGQQIGESGFYLKSGNSFSNLVRRVPSPSEDRRKTMRVDTDNEISYPTRISFVQFTPWVGGDTTYYSRTNDARRPTDIVRGTFKTGADFSTRFMKAVSLNKGLLGTGIKRLRHIIAPGVSYRYQHVPSFAASRLNQFDSAIDGLDKDHTIGFSLENKIQAKRGKYSFDLLRFLTSVAYTVKQKGVKSNLGPVKNLVEFTPAEWVRVVSETTFDHRKGHLSEGNFDFYFKKTDRFGFSFGEHYTRGGTHDLVTQLAYVVNPKWRFRIYTRFDPISSLDLKQDQYMLTRDLHEWEMNLMYGQTRGSGTEVLMSFKLKAFPDQPLDLFGTSFHQRKAGSQSSIEP
ncbi:MAG: hypothetical protein HY591_00510 [Candidatus Omnitrophica bacterium]|nr:hypothetical protein [Candidatus Omnitrophota bacterium]